MGVPGAVLVDAGHSDLVEDRESGAAEASSQPDTLAVEDRVENAVKAARDPVSRAATAVVGSDQSA